MSLRCLYLSIVLSAITIIEEVTTSLRMEFEKNFYENLLEFFEINKNISYISNKNI